MTDRTPTAKPRMTTGLRIVFGLSLALNVLVIGALVGVWLRHDGPDAQPGARAGIGKVLYQELSQEDRQLLRRELRDSVDRRLLRSVRIGPELDAALRAEEFDVEAVRGLMERQASALQTGQMAMREGWLELLAGMSREDRLAYADRLKNALPLRARGTAGGQARP